jgi:iron complex transport system permease protein
VPTAEAEPGARLGRGTETRSISLAAPGACCGAIGSCPCPTHAILGEAESLTTPGPDSPPSAPQDRPVAHPARPWFLPTAGLGLIALVVVSLFVGVADVTPAALLTQGADGEAARLLVVSRLPRTLALVLAGAATAIAGLLMQMLVRNKFVEPSTTGVTESATLGLLVVLIVAPGLPLLAKMSVAAVFAVAGTALFLTVLRAVPARQTALVPLVGIMLGGVIGAVTTFFAYRLDLLQALGAWTQGDFSGVLRGRYELLWLAGILTAVAWFAADRFTVAGLGADVATNLGLNHRRVLWLGLVIISVTSAVVVVTAGTVPFLGLVVPNIVSLWMGDHLRRSIPWVALLGSSFLVLCDIAGRLIRYPYEVPLGVVVGVVGAVLFLWLLLRKESHVH